MKGIRRSVTAILVLAAACMGAAQQPGLEAHSPSQAAADAIRDAAGVDGAFVAAGQVKPTFDRDDLSTLMQYPDDEIVIVTLKGADIKAAFERSLSLYPQSNSSFLQISGFEVVFDPNAASGQRIKSVMVGGSRIDESREFKIAMPSSLGRGGYGYFKIWDRSKIERTLDVTVAKALAGKRYSESKPRWVAQP